MDDDDVQETSIVADDGAVTKTTNTATTTASAGTATATLPSAENITQKPPTESGPPKPPRPVSEAQQNEAILKEAFPGVESTVIKAVLRASGGKVEPAFNALLGI